MTKLFWMMLFTLGLGTGIAMTDADQPPFHEGPEAHRTNQMSEEAPAGPWAWQGGD